jgi:hypothetical protein
VIRKPCAAIGLGKVIFQFGLPSLSSQGVINSQFNADRQEFVKAFSSGKGVVGEDWILQRGQRMKP